MGLEAKRPWRLHPHCSPFEFRPSSSSNPIIAMPNNDTEITEEWDRQERSNQEAERQEQQREQWEEETHPSRYFFHRCVVLVSVLTGLAACNMLVGQIVSLFFDHLLGPVQYVLRLYVMLLCVLAVLVELEWTQFARESTILRLWISRGIFYTFVGVLGLDENDTATRKEGHGIRAFQVAQTYTKAASWILIVCGFLYMGMGALCLQVLYNRQRKNYQARRERAGMIREAGGGYADAPSAV